MVWLWVRTRQIFGELKFASVGLGSKLCCGVVKLFSKRPEEQWKQINKVWTSSEKFSAFYGKEFWTEGKKTWWVIKTDWYFIEEIFVELIFFFSRKFLCKVVLTLSKNSSELWWNKICQRRWNCTVCTEKKFFGVSKIVFDTERFFWILVKEEVAILFELYTKHPAD